MSTHIESGSFTTTASWVHDVGLPHVVSGSQLSALKYLLACNNTPTMSWVETQYESRPNPAYHYYPDRTDGSFREADHTPSMQTVYSTTPHHSHNSSRQTYSSGLYGPRPQPPPVDAIHGLPTPTMVPRGITELDDADADAETMELDPAVDQEPLYESEFDDSHRSHGGTRRFVGGFISGLRKFPRRMKRGFLPDRRGVQTPPPPSLPYPQSPYHSPYALPRSPHPSVQRDPYLTPSEPPAQSHNLHTNHSLTRYQGTSHITVRCMTPKGPLDLHLVLSAIPILPHPQRMGAAVGVGPTQALRGLRSNSWSQNLRPSRPLTSIPFADRSSHSKVPPAVPSSSSRSPQTTMPLWTPSLISLPSRPFPPNSHV